MKTLPTAESFSHEVRCQLAHIQDGKTCCRRTLLAVLLAILARRRSTQSGALVDLALEPGPTARLLYRFMREFCGPGASVGLLRRRESIHLVLARRDFDALLALERRSLPRSCCRRAYLRGAFLACGSLVSPRKSYHLEFVAPLDILDRIDQVCFREAILLKQYRRRRSGQAIAYLKSSEGIAGFLTLIGAHGALLTWQEVTIEKEMRNTVQRSVNCETSNIVKTVRSAQRLIGDIARMRKEGLLASLPAPLQQAALLRESYPFATLQELSELADPPVSKSGLNHRLRQLRRISQQSAVGKPSRRQASEPYGWA